MLQRQHLLSSHETATNVSFTNLRLVTNDVNAAWVDESDDTIRVVAWQELCGHRQAIHIHWHWRAGHLSEMGTNKISKTITELKHRRKKEEYNLFPFQNHSQILWG